LHLDTVDGDIPVSAILTSASVNDSQAAIPLATITKERILFNCYDLMDAAYDVPGIIEHSRSLGHVPLVDKNPRRDIKLKEAIEAENLARRTLDWVLAEENRYNARSGGCRSIHSSRKTGSRRTDHEGNKHMVSGMGVIL